MTFAQQISVGKKQKRLKNLVLSRFAERERFELSVMLAQYDGLANRWFQPLTHLSGSAKR